MVSHAVVKSMLFAATQVTVPIACGEIVRQSR
jgi:hypothetical protein